MSCCSNSAWKSQVARGALAKMPAYPRPAPEAPSQTIDKIFVNGTFLLATPSVSGEQVTAVALAGGTIADVGDATRIIKEAPKSAQQIDLKGAVLAPGFVEAHAHIIAAVQTAYMVDVSVASCPTYTDVLTAIQTTVGGQSGWFFFMNFDPSLLGWNAQTGFPQLGFAQLGAIPGTANACIFVENASGHIAYGNQNAFTACRITTSTNPGDGGSYGQTDGQLNGVMFEPSSFAPFLKHSPTVTHAQILSTTSGFLKQCQQVGITTVCDPACGIGGDLPGELELYETLSSGAFATDVVASIDLTCVYGPGGGGLPSGLTPPSAPGANGSYNGMIVPAMKIWADGSTQGYTGYLSAPYIQPVTPPGLGPNGAPDWTQPQLQALVAAARAQNWSTLIHCNGDGALDYALVTYENLNGGLKRSKFHDRIEHCTVTNVAQYDALWLLGLHVTYLNNHIYIWGDTFSQNIIGPTRAARLDAAADALQRGIVFSFHCDYATSAPGPLRYMQTAVTRTTSGGTVLGKDQAISATEALEACTIYPAQQLGIDGLVGSIVTGKRANFVQLAQDPTTVPAAQIASIPVLGTYLRGNWIAGPSS